MKDVEGQMTFPFAEYRYDSKTCDKCGGIGKHTDHYHAEDFGYECHECGGVGRVPVDTDMKILSSLDEPVDCNVEDVVQKFRARSRTGYQKYGVTTERGDLTLLEWLIHLQDELMDATIYVERLKKDIHGAINQAAHKYIHELADMGFLEVPKDGSNGQG